MLRIAGVLLVGLAAVFLVSTAISRGWISPELQLLGAALIGFSMFGAAYRLVETRTPWATTLGIGGSVVITICAGAAYAWLDLVSPTVALALVAVASAISVGVAVQLRLQPVALAATAAMLLVPPFAELIIDGSVTVIGVWLGAFAIAAAAVGARQRWMVYRFVSTWAAAVWLLLLAASLAIDSDSSYLLVGSALVALISAVLWVGPMLAERSIGPLPPAMAPQPDPEGGEVPSTLTGLAVEHRAAAAIPLWAWLCVVFLGGYDIEDRSAVIGLAIGAGFLAVALAARFASGGFPEIKVRSLGSNTFSLSEIGFLSHLLGAGLLITVSLMVLFGGPVLIVAIAAQAFITLAIAYHFSDMYLKVNAAVLAAAAWLLLLGEFAEVIRVDTAEPVDQVARAVAVFVLAGSAWLVDRKSDRTTAAVANGFAWATVLGFATTLAALAPPIFNGEGWLVFGVGTAALSAVVSKRLGQIVLAIGAGIGLLTMLATAVSILSAIGDGADGLGPGFMGHLAHFIVVAALAGTTYVVWNHSDERVRDAPFVATWLLGLGWIAAVLVGAPQGQVAISVLWAVAACGAVVAGIGTGRVIVRRTGLATLALVLVKLFTVDLAEVETLWRVALFLVIGLGLLRLGYALPALAARYGITANGDPEVE